MTKRTCTGTTKAGNPCKSNPIDGHDTCIAHATDEVKASKGFGGAQEGGGRPKTPRITDVYAEELHRRVGEHVEDLIGRLLAIALDAERTVVVGTGPNARTEIAPDQALQLAALRELHDRVLGRPKQTTEFSGPNGDPIVVELPTAQEWHGQVATVLAQVGALPSPTLVTNGNGNGNGHRPDQN
jgi:hypothetical protein